MAIRFHWMHRNHWENDRASLVSMVKTIEKFGISSVLLPYGPIGTDFLLHVPYIFQATKTLKAMVALPAYAVTPEYAIRTFDTIQQYGPNRLDLNLVAGNYNEDTERNILSNYPGNTEEINSHQKRVALTDRWMEKFVNLLKDQKFKTTLHVVGSSDTTIELANKYTDYLILNDNFISQDLLDKVIGPKIMLVIDPLIINPENQGEAIEYCDYQYSKPREHSIQGTYEEVKEIILQLSRQYNIKDFLVNTDQKNIDQLLKLIKEITEETFNK